MKFILTLLISVFAAGFLHAQTAAPAAPAEPLAPATPTESVAPAAPAEPAPRKIAYEVVPAKRVATPAKEGVAVDVKPTDLNKLQAEQEMKKTIEKRQAHINGTAPVQPQPVKKEGATETKPKQ